MIGLVLKWIGLATVWLKDISSIVSRCPENAMFVWGIGTVLVPRGDSTTLRYLWPGKTIQSVPWLHGGTLASYKNKLYDTVDGQNPAPVEVGRLSHYVQGFIHTRRIQAVQDFVHQQYECLVCSLWLFCVIPPKWPMFCWVLHLSCGSLKLETNCKDQGLRITFRFR